MTTPQPPRTITYQEAVAALAAAQALPSGDPTQITSIASEALITAREHATQWALTLILRAWRGVDVYDGVQVQAFTEQAGRYVVTAQTAVARTAAATQSRILSSMGVQASGLVASDPVDVRGTPTIGGDDRAAVEQGRSEVIYQDGGRQVVDLDEDATTVGMFNRPARTQRYLESKGLDSVHARQEAEDRLSLLVGDNLMLAQRLAEAEILAQAASVDERVIGLRRVIHPELSRTGVCGLCIAAADRVYRVRELHEIHTNCKCTVAAVTAEFDPADVLNKADLKQLFELAGGTAGPGLKRVRYQVDEHGELGPTLVPAKPFKPRKNLTPARRTNDAPRRRKRRARASS